MRQLRFLEAHVDLERRIQQSLRDGHGSECEIDGEAHVQSDNLAGSLVQAPSTLQLTLRVDQCGMELGEGKPLRRFRLQRQLALETRFSPRTSKLCLERGASAYDVWKVEELLQIGQVNLSCVQLDILQLLAMHSAGEFNGLLVVHQVYLCEVKPLRSKGHLERGRRVPGTVR